MKQLVIPMMILAGCAPNGVAPAPATANTNAGAFVDPPAARSQGRISGWVVLANAPTIDLSQTHVMTTSEPFATLMLKATDGEPEIEQIEIEYVDHQRRTVKIERRFAAGEGQVIELREKRPIAKIVVYTDPDSKGQYILYGA